MEFFVLTRPRTLTVWALLVFLIGVSPSYGALSYVSPFKPAPIRFDTPSYTSHVESTGTVTQLRLRRNSSAYDLLKKAGLSHELIMKIVRAARSKKNLSKLRPGTRMAVHWSEEGVRYPSRFEVKLNKLDRLVVEPKSGGARWKARIESTETQTQYMGYRGTIRTSFWRSAMNAGLNARTTVKLASIFGSLVDFAREVQRKDKWRLVVERIFVGNQPIGWGNIVAAEVEVEGIIYSANFFPKSELKHDYYSASGASLRRMFLKSPIRFGRVTSKFSFTRFHPVLKVKRPHLGVDYGAPVGTPVRAVGQGVVTFARYNGAGGKTVKIRHSSKYRTSYLHLSRFARGIKRGKQVKMGQVIGYVGKTGRVTGPHLHYEFYINGKVVDPLGVEFPSLDPIPEEILPEFLAVSEQYRNYLPDWPEPMRANASNATPGA